MRIKYQRFKNYQWQLLVASRRFLHRCNSPTGQEIRTKKPTLTHRGRAQTNPYLHPQHHQRYRSSRSTQGIYGAKHTGFQSRHRPSDDGGCRRILRRK